MIIVIVEDRHNPAERAEVGRVGHGHLPQFFDHCCQTLGWQERYTEFRERVLDADGVCLVPVSAGEVEPTR